MIWNDDKTIFCIFIACKHEMSKILEIKDRRIAFYSNARKMHFIDFESIDSFMRYDHEYGFSNVVSVLTSL